VRRPWRVAGGACGAASRRPACAALRVARAARCWRCVRRVAAVARIDCGHRPRRIV